MLDRLDNKELLIMSHFRQNARKNLTKISRETGIPVSTIFDKLRKYNGSLIRKHTCLLDFSKLGYDVRVTLMLRIPKERREEVKSFLMARNDINTIYRINNGYDYLVEGIFKGMRDYQQFMERLDDFKIKSRNEFYVLDEIKREGFLSDPKMLKTLGREIL